MNRNELALIEQIRPTNQQLSRLLQEHEGYESRLASLARQRWRSAEDYAEEQRLKRLKLAGRDRIQEILSAHRVGS